MNAEFYGSVANETIIGLKHKQPRRIMADSPVIKREYWCSASNVASAISNKKWVKYITLWLEIGDNTYFDECQ